MFLADQDILKEIELGRIKIKPLVRSQVQPAGYDLRLHHNFRVWHNADVTHIDVKRPFEVTELVKVRKGEAFVVHPREFVLASTWEHITLPNDLVGILEGRSSLGRIGLIVHATAALVNPGNSGHLTFEITNLSSLPIKLYPKMRIAQLSFVRMTSPARVPYGQGKLGNKYQDQQPPTASKIWKDFE